MKKHCILLLAILSAATSCISEAEMSMPETTETAGAKSLQTKMTGSTSGDYKDGCLLLYLTEETTERIENGEMEEVAAEMFAGLEVSDFQKALRHAPKNTELARELGLHRWFVVYFDESMPVRSFAEAVAVASIEVSPYLTRHEPFARPAIFPVSITRGLPARVVSNTLKFSNIFSCPFFLIFFIYQPQPEK
jgi:hypothetical protein